MLGETDNERLRFSRTTDGGVFTIPARWDWSRGGFLLIWLCGWTMGGFTAVNALLSKPSTGGSAFLLFWLCGWALGEAAVTHTLWQMAFGRQIFDVQGERLRYVRGSWPFQTSIDFDMRMMQHARTRFEARESSAGAQDSLLFAYGAKTVFLGESLATDEARRVAAYLRERLAALAVNSAAPRLGSPAGARLLQPGAS